MTSTMDAQRFSIPGLDRLDLLEADPSANPTAAMRPYVRFDPAEGAVWFGTSYQISGTLEPIYHGRIREYSLDAGVDETALVDYLRSATAQQLLGRIADGHAIIWDGNNHVGRLNDDARAAEDALAHELETLPGLPSESAGLWDAADWLEPIQADLRDELRADPTDATVETIYDREAADAAFDHVVLAGLRSYLDDLLDDVKREEEATANA